ncbi:MAG: hypothetical protein AAF556_13285, partial [Pseudomonadota bacterium]
TKDNKDPEELETALDKLLTDRQLWTRAHETAKAVSTRPQGDAVGTVVTGCLQLLGNGSVVPKAVLDDVILGGSGDIIIDEQPTPVSEKVAKADA